ncbi:MAG: CBS domain-containing protein, partial [Nitrospirae bacterium]
FRCGLCKQACAFDAVKETRDSYFIDRQYCQKCRACYQACPIGAVKVYKERHVVLMEALKITPEEVETIERRVRMKLKDILEKKGREVITVSPETTLSDATKLMSEKKIGGVMVVDEQGKLVGMVTERDVLHQAAKGVDFSSVKVSDVMSKELVTFSPEDDIAEALATVTQKKKRHLPIVEEGKPVGMITYRDIVSYVLPEVVYMAEEIY